MRRISRINRPIDCLRQQPTSSYTCIACRHRAAFTTSLPRSKSAPFTDRLRQKIWGSDEPPGLKNPYGESKSLRKKDSEDEGTELPEESTSKPRAFTGPFAEGDDIPGGYLPASKGNTLERVGGRKTTGKKERNFKGFIPVTKAKSDYQKTIAVHRAVVEVYTLRQAEKPLAIREPLSQRELLEDRTTDVQFVKTKAGGQLVYTEEQSQEKILQSLIAKPEKVLEASAIINADGTETEEVLLESNDLQPEGEGKHDEQMSLEEISMRESKRDHHKNLIANWDPTWLNVSLEDPEIKFAVFKRVLQLTGIRIHDSQISSVTDVKSLLARLVKPPQTRPKVAKAIQQKGTLKVLPNITFSRERITMVDKEKSIGRWKIIQKELRRRKLPSTVRGIRRQTL